MKSLSNASSACLIILFLSSCSAVFFGFRKPRKISDGDILRQAHAFQITLDNLYASRNAKLFYCYHLQNVPGGKPLAKDHMQPLQALYFDKNGRMISWHINCLADASMGRINWNRNHVMETFPPGQAALPDSALSLDYLQKMIRPLSGTLPFDGRDYDYTIVVYWNAFIRKASKGLIHAIKKNLLLAGEARVKLIWVNNESDFAGGSAPLTKEDQQLLDEIFKLR